MAFCGMPEQGPEAGVSSEALAAMWKPYIETCIEAFGPERGMFESNYPVDKWGASYATLWNAFKRIAAGASVDEHVVIEQKSSGAATQGDGARAAQNTNPHGWLGGGGRTGKGTPGPPAHL